MQKTPVIYHSGTNSLTHDTLYIVSSCCLPQSPFYVTTGRKLYLPLLAHFYRVYPVYIKENLDKYREKIFPKGKDLMHSSSSWT